MKKIIIAIDGFSSTGKSTVAKELARALEYVYVDTGAMYRAVTLFALKNGWIEDDKIHTENLIENLDKITLQFIYNSEKGFGEMHLNQQNVEEEIRSMRVSKYVSKIAKISEVRKLLVRQQADMGKEKGVVMDGRDIGTVVFPQAELKLFMTASPEIRAQRRFDELRAKGDDITYEEVLENVKMRDQIDTEREESPLRKADDAVEIDNSKLSREEQFEKIMQLVHSRIG